MAPVVLFVFNRYKELPKTLACLKDNQIDKIYAFCDGPRNEADEAGVFEVRKLVRAIDWAEVEMVEHDTNQGLSQSIQNGLDDIFKTYDRAIIIEDDICVAPGFYQYMQECLEKYQDNPEVAGVTGLRYPFNRKHLPVDADVFFAPRFSSWGWGTWKRFWQEVDFDRESLVSKIGSAKIDPAALAGGDIKATYQAFANGELQGCWDVYCLLSMLVRHQVFVWPTHNFVRNTGLDEGTHASGVASNWSLDWEPGYVNTPRLPDRIVRQDDVLRDFVDYFAANHKGDTSMIELAKKVRRKLIKILKDEGAGAKPDPKDYSTTDEPMEVPCQKEAYYLALNNYMRDGDTVLDVGCGIGYGLNLLSIRAKEASGVDVDPKAIEYCRQNIFGKNPRLKTLEVYDGYNLPFKDNEFDVVTTVDVLEHVEDYHRFIDELLRVAKRVVLISTPNRRPEYTNPDGSPKNYWHLREWSYAELKDILSQHKAGVDWNFVNGPWDGPFVATDTVQDDTMTLTPALIVK